MRIAFAMINCNRRDGSARAVNEVAERLAKRGHDVHIYARTVEDLDVDLVTWHRVPGPGRPEVADFWTFQRALDRRLRNHSYDIVHSIGPNTLRADVVTIQNIQPVKKRVLDRLGKEEHVSLSRRITRALYLRVTSCSEEILYTARNGHCRPTFLPVSRGVERELRETYSIGDAPVRIVPNAADTEVFHPAQEDERARWRASAGLEESDVVCLFSGGEWARKGLDFAIRGVARVPHSHVKLFVAGDDPDRARFEALAQSEGVAERVVFGGFRNDISTAMGSADLFLLPSHYEAFSLATIEAAACGLPVVATKINGTEDFIEPGENGEFVTHDPSVIAEVLTRLVADPAAMREMGRKARRLVKQRYTWDRVAELTEEAYRLSAAVS